MSGDSLVHFLMLALGYPQLEQVCFWTWRDRLPVGGTFISTRVHSISQPMHATRAANLLMILLALHAWSLVRFPTYRSVCTERASCCGACRKMQYPWLFQSVSDPGLRK